MRLVIAGLLLSAAAFSAAYAQERIPTKPAPQPGEVVVRGRVQRPVPPPPGDSRTDAQRMRDVRAWDRCVTRAQSFGDDDPMRYQAQSPEEYCRQQLGMADRLAVPISR